MNNTQSIPSGTISQNDAFIGFTPKTSYQWNNLIIEKQVSINWLDELYKESIFYGFWKVLTSPVS